jgi:hypothetical protein
MVVSNSTQKRGSGDLNSSALMHKTPSPTKLKNKRFLNELIRSNLNATPAKAHFKESTNKAFKTISPFSHDQFRTDIKKISTPTESNTFKNLFSLEKTILIENSLSDKSANNFLPKNGNLPRVLHEKKKKQTKSRKIKFKMIGKSACVCYRWWKWANERYKLTIYRYISFCQMTDLVDEQIEFEINIRNTIRNEDFELEDVDELLHGARIKAEMMNFNKDFYKAQTRPNYKLNQQTVQLLKKPNRTEDDITDLISAFRKMYHLKFINSLQPDVKRKLFECCWLEEFEQKRVIVSQDHKANSFYLILSGSVVGTYKPTTDLRSYTVCFLEKDMSFGDLPLLNDSVHTATIASRTDCQLLVVSKEDFFYIFSTQTTKISTSLLKFNSQSIDTFASSTTQKPNSLQDSLSEYMSLKPSLKTMNKSDLSFEDNMIFLHTLPYLKSFPLKLIREKPKLLKTCIYPRGKLITKDSHSTKYIYIIKSGYLSVWLKLVNKNQHSNQISERNEGEKVETDSDINRFFSKNEKLTDHFYETIDKRNNEQVLDIEGKIRYNQVMEYLGTVRNYEKEFNKIDDPSELNPTIRANKLADSIRLLEEQNRFVKNSIEQDKAHRLKSLIGHSDRTLTKHESGMNEKGKNINHSNPSFKLPQLKKLNVESFAYKNKNESTKDQQMQLPELKESTHRYEANKNYSINTVSARFMRPPNKDDPNSGTTNENNNLLMNKIEHEEIRDSDETNSLLSDDYLDETLSFVTDKKPNRVDAEFEINSYRDFLFLDDEHLLVQKLYAGDQFGLTDLLFDAQPRMQLISEGCECILLPKDFFIKNTSIDLVRELRRQLRAYPRLELLEMNYKKHLEWRDYTRKTLRSSLEQRRSKKQIHQALFQF